MAKTRMVPAKEIAAHPTKSLLADDYLKKAWPKGKKGADGGGKKKGSGKK